jgi:DNA-binding transcriptional LysR family regulator
VDSRIEVDSLEAIDALVRHGLGVSVAPRRRGAARSGLRTAPLGAPPLRRVLVLLDRPRNPRARLADALYAALCGAAAPNGA